MTKPDKRKIEKHEHDFYLVGKVGDIVTHYDTTKGIFKFVCLCGKTKEVLEK